MSSFVPTNIDNKREEEKISEEFLNAPQPYNWNIGDEPLSEFDCQFLASMAFPTLFPDGKGDPTNSALLSDTSKNTTQSFAAKLKHLIKFSEKIDGKWAYRFTSHPRFAYWAYNILYRRRILAQGNFFLKQNPSEANLTISDLKEIFFRACAPPKRSEVFCKRRPFSHSQLKLTTVINPKCDAFSKTKRYLCSTREKNTKEETGVRLKRRTA
jgi:hypothetical protein